MRARLRALITTEGIARSRRVELGGRTWELDFDAVAARAFLLLTVLAFFLFMHLSRFLTFYWDEWDFIDGRSMLNWHVLVTPHNEHFVFLQVFAYSSLVSIFGLGSYQPFMALLYVLHLLTAGAIYYYARHYIGAIAALVPAVVFMTFGTGYENLFWGFQIGFVGATAAGLWAVVLMIVRPQTSRILIAALLAVAVTTMTNGLVFVGTAVVIALASSHRLRNLLPTIPALLIYAAWFVTIGRTRAPSTPASGSLLDIVSYVGVGLASTVDGLLGLGRLPAAVFLAVGVFLVLVALWRRTHAAALIGIAAGLVGEFVAVAVGRGEFGVEVAASSRYMYVSAALMLVLLVTLVAAWRPRVDRRILLGASTAVVALALVTNVPRLTLGRNYFLAAGDATRAYISVMDRYGGSPAVPNTFEPSDSYPQLPPVEQLDRLNARYNVFNATLAGPYQPREEVLDAVLRQVVADQIEIVSPAPAGTAVPADVESTGDASAIIANGLCVTAHATSSTGPIDARVSDGNVLVLSGEPVNASVSLSRYGTFDYLLAIPSRPTLDPGVYPVVGSGNFGITMPVLEQGGEWIVRIELEGGPAEICERVGGAVPAV